MGTKEANSLEPRHFTLYTSGLKTNRDAWCYNFSAETVAANMSRMVANYNQQALLAYGASSQLSKSTEQISWSRGLVADALRGVQHTFKADRVYSVFYRPFTREAGYYDRPLNDMVYRLGAVFPTRDQANISLFLPAPGASAPPFMALMSSHLIDLGACGISAAQFFPRWTYETADGGDQAPLVDPSGDIDEWGYRRVDNITDGILKVYRDAFGNKVTKDDVFFYLYGVLHSRQYRTTFAAELKRMLPRIPLASSAEDFAHIVEAGRDLSDLHVDYENVEPYPLAEQGPLGGDPWTVYRVEKMKWADKATKKAIIYNKHVTLGDIPADAHRYMLGSRSALEWLIDRYQVKTDKASGIVNDPNDWGREHDDPRYIVDLVKRVTRVSVETMKIVDALPELPI